MIIKIAEDTLQASLSEEVKQYIASKSNGNPLFSESVAVALADSQLITLQDGVYHFNSSYSGRVELPDSMEVCIHL